jgi:hypothetical protein
MFLDTVRDPDELATRLRLLDIVTSAEKLFYHDSSDNRNDFLKLISAEG